jgi:anthranilate phosphoribosyltransferase
LPLSDPKDLKGGDADYNADAIRAVLAGETGAYRDIVLFGAAAALIVAGRTDDLKEGVTIASDAISSGRALKALETMVAITNEGAA